MKPPAGLPISIELTEGHSLSWDGDVYEVNCPKQGNGWSYICAWSDGSGVRGRIHCDGCDTDVRATSLEVTFK